MTQPDLIFHCELCGLDRQELFSDDTLIRDLVEMNAGVALALPVFSAACAQVVHRLNQAGIRAYAWLLLPREQGYFFNTFNARQAVARYEAFQAWTARHDLKWTGMVLDFRPSKSEFSAFTRGLPASLLFRWAARLFTSSQVALSQQTYRKLIRKMHNDGYTVDTFQLPWIADERRVGSKILQRMLGFVNVLGNREVFLLHTSQMGARGAGVLWSYAPEASAIAVGSTGGSILRGGHTPLSWEQFSRDLLLARQRRKDIYIHSLEGCARQGFIPYLKKFDWVQPITPPAREAKKVESNRRIFRSALWVAAHPLLIVAGALGLAGLWQLIFAPRNPRGQDTLTA